MLYHLESHEKNNVSIQSMTSHIEIATLINFCLERLHLQINHHQCVYVIIEIYLVSWLAHYLFGLIASISTMFNIWKTTAILLTKSADSLIVYHCYTQNELKNKNWFLVCLYEHTNVCSHVGSNMFLPNTHSSLLS